MKLAHGITAVAPIIHVAIQKVSTIHGECWHFSGRGRRLLLLALLFHLLYVCVCVINRLKCLNYFVFLLFQGVLLAKGQINGVHAAIDIIHWVQAIVATVQFQVAVAVAMATAMAMPQIIKRRHHPFHIHQINERVKPITVMMMIIISSRRDPVAYKI